MKMRDPYAITTSQADPGAVATALMSAAHLAPGMARSACLAVRHRAMIVSRLRPHRYRIVIIPDEAGRRWVGRAGMRVSARSAPSWQ